jgi:hypothetical protein
VLSPAQIKQWRQDGWLVLDGVYPPELVASASAAAKQLFPANGQPHTPQVDAFVEAGHHSALTSAEYPNAS